MTRGARSLALALALAAAAGCGRDDGGPTDRAGVDASSFDRRDGGDGGAAAGPCGGETPAKDDGGTWACTWSDEFDGGALDDSKWTVVTDATPDGYGWN